jgi:hypothetical protein
MVGWIQYVFLSISSSELSLRMVPMASWLLTLFSLLKIGVKIRQKLNAQGFDGFVQKGIPAGDCRLWFKSNASLVVRGIGSRYPFDPFWC